MTAPQWSLASTPRTSGLRVVGELVVEVVAMEPGLNRQEEPLPKEPTMTDKPSRNGAWPQRPGRVASA